MNVTTRPEPCFTRIELEGSIDGKTAPQIREELSAPLQQVQKLILDISRVDYLSSAGLRLLLLLAQRLEAHRKKCGNPAGGPIFANKVGHPPVQFTMHDASHENSCYGSHEY